MYNSYRQHFMAFWGVALLAISMLWGGAAYAATPAGTIITNLATVTYSDSLGNSYTAQSNESAVTVAKIYAAKLNQSQSKEGAAGQTVYFPHQLVNNGNTEDSFALDVTPTNLTSWTIYLDTNGNGQPDANEPVITPATANALKVMAGTTANLIVAAQVPADAEVGGSHSLILTASSENGSFELDTDAKNTDTITIVANAPVLVVTKEEISHTSPTWIYPENAEDPTTLSLGSITYRIKVTNNGAPLTAGAIYDFLPDFMDVTKATDNDGKGVSFNINDARLDTPEIKVDLDDKLPPGTLPADVGYHTSAIEIPFKNPLASGASLSFDFTVTYSAKDGETPEAFQFDAGQILENTAYVGYNLTNADSTPNPTTPWDKVGKSNTTSTTLTHLFDVTAEKKVDGGYLNPLISEAGGDVAKFQVTVTNTGNGEDSFNLTVNNDDGVNTGFPAGTVFSFWNHDGTLPLANDNTGPVAKNALIVVMVKAQLPQGAKGTPSSADFVATSVGDSLQRASVELKLDSISGAFVDLSSKGADKPAGDDDKYPTLAEVKELAPGSTQSFDLYVYNEAGIPKSFSLSAHGSVNGEDRNTYAEATALPEGLRVTFKNGGQIITQTPLIEKDGKFSVTVEVTVPADQAAGDLPFAVMANSGSGNSKINDAISYKVTVTDSGTVNLTPNGANQINAGGSTFYNHRLINDSNSTSAFMVEGEHSTGDWSHIMSSGKEPATGTIIINPTYVAIVLAPNEYLDFQVKVMSPATAQPGFIDTLKLTAVEVQMNGNSMVVDESGKPVKVTANGLTSIAIDTTTVIKGQVRLKKQVAVIEAATPEAAKAAAKLLKADDFGVTTEAEATPGESYVVWQVVATNDGNADAKNVVIVDAAPAFTSLVKDSAYIVGELGTAVEADPNVTFTIDDPDNDVDVDLKPGASVEVRFMVTVD